MVNNKFKLYFLVYGISALDRDLLIRHVIDFILFILFTASK